MQELWGSDDLRAAELTVTDEVRGGLIHFSSTLADAIPRIYRDLEEAVAEFYPETGGRPRVPPLLSFGSWIGGDRDGNPYVTPETTVAALELMREQCLRLLESRRGAAGRPPLALRAAHRRGPGPGADPRPPAPSASPSWRERLAGLNPEEPYRRALTFMRERIRATRPATPADTPSPRDCSPTCGPSRPRCVRGRARSPPARTCATSSARSRSSAFTSPASTSASTPAVHRRALAEIYGALRVCEDYEGLAEDARVTLLQAQIADRRPLIPTDIDRFSEATQDTIQTFRTLRATLAGPNRGAIQTYIISGSEGPPTSSRCSCS